MAEANLGTARGRIEIDASGAVKGFQDSEKAAAGFVGGLEQHSRSLDRAGKALVGIGVAAIGGLGVAVKTAANFEQSMNKVAAVSGVTGAEFDALREQAKELGRTTAFSASEAAEAMYFLSSAGFDVAEMMTAMPGILDLAAAGNLDLATAADIASNILSGYGFEAEEIGRVNDVMAGTFKNANTNVAQLGDAMKFVAPVASASGVSFEEAAAAIGKLSDAGIQGGMAGTTLRGIISALEKPTGQAADAIERLGIKTHDSSGMLLPLADIVGQLEESGLSTADAMTIFGQRAGPGMMALVGQGADSLAELTTKLEESGGTAQAMADRQLEGLNGALTQMKSALEGAAIGIGEQLLPFVTRLAEAFTGLVQWVGDLSPGMQKLIAIGTAVGGALAIVAGAALMFLSRLPMIIAGVKALGGALSFISLGPIALAVAAIAAVVAGLVLAYKHSETFRDIVQRAMEGVKDAIQWVKDAWDKIVQGFKNGGSDIGQGVNEILGPFETFGGVIRQIADTVRDVFLAAMEKVGEVFTKVRGFIDDFVQGWQNGSSQIGQGVNTILGPVQQLGGIFRDVAETIRSGIGSAIVWLRETFEMFRPQVETAMASVGTMVSKFGELMTVLKPVGTFIGGVMVGGFKLLVGALQMLWNVAKPVLGFLATMIGDTIRMAISGVVQVFRGAVQIISGILDVFIGLFTGNWSRMWEGIKSIATGIFNAIVGAVKVWLSIGIFKAIGAAFKGIIALFRGSWNMIANVFRGALNGIRNTVTGAFNAVRGFIQSSVNGVRNIIQNVWNAIFSHVRTALSSIRSGITNAFNTYRAYIGTVMSAIRNGITTAWGAIRAVISNVISAIRNIISNAFSAIRNTMSNAANGAKSAVVNAFNSLKSSVSNTISNLMTTVRGIPGRIKSALGNLGSLLLNSGKEIIRGLIKGITAMGDRVKDAVGGVMKKARDLLPFSPAKEGPFSGKGWSLYSGRSIVQALAKGIKDEERRAVRTTSMLASKMHDSLSGALSEPAMAVIGGGSAGPGPSMAGLVDVRRPASGPTSSSSTMVFNGDIILPNVTDRSKADDLLDGLRQAARRR